MSAAENQEIALLDNISLTNLGTYMFFDDVTDISSLELCEYIIKANIVLPPDDAITIFINSDGGSCTDGWAIIDLMEMSKVDIQTVAIGCIASMATAIFITGTEGKRIMTPNSQFMMHQFSGGVYGKSHELMAARKFHDRLDKQFIQHFVRHTKMTEAQVKEILLGPSDAWLTPEECLEFGICDEVRNPWDETPVKKAARKAPPKKKKS